MINPIISRGRTLLRHLGLTPRAPYSRPGSVAMLHIGRCGSTVVASQLLQNSRIHWSGELFLGDSLLADSFRRQSSDRWPWGKSRFFPFAPYLYIGERMQQARKGLIYGFEVKYYHIRLNGLTFAGFVATLKRLGVTHWILLTRRNTLRKVVSGVIGNSVNYYQVDKGKKSTRNPIVLETDHVRIESQDRPLLDVLRQSEQDQVIMRELLGNEALLQLYYEDDIEHDPTRAYARMCEFLCVPSGEVSIEMSRTNPYPLRELLVNYEEVRRVLAGSTFEWMLDE